MLPGPPALGPPVSWFLGLWLAAREDEPIECFDELDAERGRYGVRRFRDSSLKAYSYVSANWRDHMPEAPIPPLEEVNANPEFRAKAITKAEFEVVWGEAQRADIG